MFPEYAARRLAAISFFGMQSQQNAERAVAIGADPARVEVLGNMKFDGLPDPTAPRSAELLRLLRFDSKAPVLVAASTHAPEETIVASAAKRLRETFPDLRLVIVPRHVERAGEIASAIAPILGEPILLSRLRGPNAPAGDLRAPVVVDTIGDLDAIYRFATVAFVGGSLENARGGQNMLEPAALGVPVVHGPAVPNFAEAAACLAAVQGSRVAASLDSLTAQVGELLADPGAAAAQAVRAKAALEPHRGAAARTAHALLDRNLV
jgi:3-deoxy-D-manno-octulosonic-acid transferase